MKGILCKAKMICVLLFISYSLITAQTFNMQSIPTDNLELGFGFNKAFYSGGPEFSTFSGSYDFSVNIPLSNSLNLSGNIPLIVTKYDFGYQGNNKYDKNGLGNIYIGLQTKPDSSGVKKSFFSFGVFLPTADEQVSFNGLYNDYYHLLKFVPNIVGLYGNYSLHHIGEEGFIYGLEAGPNIFIPTEGNGDTEIFVHYGFTAGYKLSKVSLKAEFIGFAIITEDADNLSDRMINMFNLGLHYQGSVVSPSLFYKLYLKDALNNNIDGVLGLGVTVSIN
ncbi:MAG: hypothetical protein KKA84_03010 [Bacteroidetes bacterium]|nr:hypothetical protein [Bacteroidota bacterium]